MDTDELGHRVYTPGGMFRARLTIGTAVSFAILDLFVVPALLHSITFERFLWALLLMVILVTLTCLSAVRFPDLGLLFEMQIRQTIMGVCREAGLYTHNDKNEIVRPRLSQLMGNTKGWNIRIRTCTGQSFDQWDKALGRFSMAFHGVDVRIRMMPDGMLMMSTGPTRLAAENIRVPAPSVSPDGKTWDEFLERVAVAGSEKGGPYRIPVAGGHILVAGISGAGKNSLIWSLVIGLLPGIRAGVVKVWGVDPKRMELAIGRGFFEDRYAHTEELIVKLLERAVSEMQALADKYGGDVRKVSLGPEVPLNLFIVDELAYMTSLMTDRTLQKKAEHAIKTLLTQGRALGWVVVGAIQDPRKSTLDYRDLFPTCVAMKLPEGMVDLVLGDGAHAAGAECETIPKGPEGAGTAYVLEEGEKEPRLIRAPWSSDAVIKDAASGIFQAPDRTGWERPVTGSEGATDGRNDDGLATDTAA